MPSNEPRIERDSLGEIEVPATALWGAQTQRAVNNFKFSALRMPPKFIAALGLIKQSAAAANEELGELDERRARAIRKASAEVAQGLHDAHFPVDVFQTGSGTSSNMNANEVSARLAGGYASGLEIHPNDHVNMGQSSNDVIPTAIHVSASLALKQQLLPALRELAETIEHKADEFGAVVKTGRTHLMDAMPLTIGQEFSAWRSQVLQCVDRLLETNSRLQEIAQGGTAVGTGVNAHPEFAARFAAILGELTGVGFHPSANFFRSLSSQDTAVELSGQLRIVAVCLTKISNDLRWMNSGPLAGLGEIHLPALQPGSSIMPGKVNPVIPEAVTMASAQVFGNDVTVTVAGQSGNFQLNVMLPVIAHALLQSIELMTNSALSLARTTIDRLRLDEQRIGLTVDRNPMLVTALSPVLGYERAAAIAHSARQQGRPILDVAVELTDLRREDLASLLDPARLTGARMPPREEG